MISFVVILGLRAKEGNALILSRMWSAVIMRVVDRTVNASSRRWSESRMRENLTHGSRWQGMKTKIG